jgi:hypothetical protein
MVLWVAAIALIALPHVARGFAKRVVGKKD